MEWEAVEAGSQQADHRQARPCAGKEYEERSVHSSALPANLTENT